MPSQPCDDRIMAKTKMNERKDYGLSKTDVIVYKKSRIPRQKQYMILRGPGLDVQVGIEENAEIKKLAARRHFKIKFMQANTVEDVVKWLKDANTWASAVVYDGGTLKDEAELIKKTVKKILIPAIQVSFNGKINSMLDGLEEALKGD